MGMNATHAPTPDAECANTDSEASATWSLTGVIARLRRVLRSSVRRDFPWESLPMAQVEVLQRLADEPGLGVKELAARQRLAVNTVSGLIQQMVASGLVERTAHQSDRRAVHLQPSKEGAEVLEAWQAANDRRLRHALERLPHYYQDAIQNAVPALAALAAELEADDRSWTGDPAIPRDA
jgi:DNA-binding MarR family transcriptional regulator